MFTRRTPIPPRSSLQAGFTLLEVLVALALSTVLMVAVYAALDLYWQYSIAGRDEVARMQVARALFNRIELDLRCVLYRAEAAATSTAAADTESTDITIQVSDPTESAMASDSGLFGDAGTLMFHISQPSRTLDYAPFGSQPGSRTSDLQTVSWFVARKGAGGLQGAVAEREEGLTRSAGDRLSTEMADDSGNMSLLVGQAKVLAPEVSGVQFEYFDGAAWQSTWDSTQSAGLPRAVRVILQFSASPDGTVIRHKLEAKNYSITIPLAVAKPTST